MSLTNALLALILVTLIIGGDTVKSLIKIAFSVCVLIPYEYAKEAFRSLSTGEIGKAYTVLLAIFVAIAAAYSFIAV